MWDQRDRGVGTAYSVQSDTIIHDPQASLAGRAPEIDSQIAVGPGGKFASG